MISINFRDSRPIYEQVKDGFRQLILSGVLAADEKMPSVRELAGSLAINPNTIQRAYRELEAEGYICSVPGRGSFVMDRRSPAEARRRELLGELDELVKELQVLGMNREERQEAVRRDPLYGNIVCRCETVTEAEIVRAIRRPVGARTIDGVKRRCRAGMGRCQGGFCSPRVAQIISDETGIPLAEVTKDGNGSRILSDTIESFLKGGSFRD